MSIHKKRSDSSRLTTCFGVFLAMASTYELPSLHSAYIPIPVWTVSEENFVAFIDNGTDSRLYCSYGTSSTIIHTRNLKLKFAIEGFYDASLNKMIKEDTVMIYLRTLNAPYNIVDSAKCLVDANGMINTNFVNVQNNVNYFIVVKHRNSIETWSNSNGVKFLNNKLTYSFALSNGQVYGANEKQVDQTSITYAIFSGDINQDGNIDISDVVGIYNDAQNFVAGYVKTDVTGDDYVDISDLTLAYNNSINFVGMIRP